jgi:hypothetical protein
MGLVEFIIDGGMLFMGTLTLLGIVIVLLVVRSVLLLTNKKSGYEEVVIGNHSRIKSISLFAAVFGLLGQLIGLFSAFQGIAAAGGVSMEMLAFGLKISMHPTIYGLVIFLMARMLVFVLEFKNAKA